MISVEKLKIQTYLNFCKLSIIINFYHGWKRLALPANRIKGQEQKGNVPIPCIWRKYLSSSDQGGKLSLHQRNSDWIKASRLINYHHSVVYKKHGSEKYIRSPLKGTYCQGHTLISKETYRNWSLPSRI